MRSAELRNTERELQLFQVRIGVAGAVVQVHDPLADAADARHEYGIELAAWDALPAADAIVLAVPHRHYLDMPLAVLTGSLSAGACVIDIKSALDRRALEGAGLRVWRL